MRPWRRRWLPPKPPEPPPGYVWFYWDLIPVAEVEQHAREVMAGFDQLPRRLRDQENYAQRVRRKPARKWQR